MGYMDLLKNAVGMNDSDSKVIDSDGKQYAFTPGPNGGMVATQKAAPQPLMNPSSSIAKTLPVKKPTQDVSAQTAAVRG